MPTPRDSTIQFQLATDPQANRSAHTTCPVENERPGRRDINDARLDPDDIIDRGEPQLQDAQSTSTEMDDPLDTINDITKTKTITMEHESTTTETSSPMSTISEPKEAELQISAPMSYGFRNYSPIDYGIPNTRMIPNFTSSFLRAGSKFTGTQQSDRQNYKVEIEIKSVDMNESELCGYLRIEGLTNDHPTLTTFFEGEIIGPKYTFQTRHESWGANDKTDMQHWGRFPAWRPLAKQAKKPDFHYKNSVQREHLFMRWKESFLVPDHRVREISGASFEGFYYICFNQVNGNVSGIYFHSRSEKYQQLELKHVEDKGCYGSIEFR